MKEPSSENGRKFLFVFYDINDNKTRSHLVKTLEELGLKRTQFSVFYDYHHTLNVESLKRGIERVVGKKPFKEGRILISYCFPLKAYGFNLKELEQPFQEYI